MKNVSVVFSCTYFRYFDKGRLFVCLFKSCYSILFDMTYNNLAHCFPAIFVGVVTGYGSAVVDVLPVAAIGCLLKHRAVRHYGYTFRYDTNDVDLSQHLADKIPQVCLAIVQRAIDQLIISSLPDQMTVNRYLPGQGICPHIRIYILARVNKYISVWVYA